MNNNIKLGFKYLESILDHWKSQIDWFEFSRKYFPSEFLDIIDKDAKEDQVIFNACLEDFHTECLNLGKKVTNVSCIIWYPIVRVLTLDSRVKKSNAGDTWLESREWKISKAPIFDSEMLELVPAKDWRLISSIQRTNTLNLWTESSPEEKAITKFYNKVFFIIFLNTD